jgi:hypothetical protein
MFNRYVYGKTEDGEAHPNDAASLSEDAIDAVTAAALLTPPPRSFTPEQLRELL